MPAQNQINDRFLRLHPEAFQKAVLLGVLRSFKFYQSVKEKLCPFEPARQSRRPDFQQPDYNKLYNLAADYWEQWGPSLAPEQDYSISLPDMEMLLSSEMNNGRLQQAEAIAIFDMLKADANLFEFDPDTLKKLPNNPMLNLWLDRRAATNIIEFAFNQRLIRQPTLAELKALVDHSQNRLAGGDNRVVRAADLMFGFSRGGIPFNTDIPNVNKVMGGGMYPGSTTLVAGINGGGKTILAMQWAKHFAMSGANVVVFTTEQPPHQLLLRAICNHLEIDFSEFTAMTPEMEQTPFSERRRMVIDRPYLSPHIQHAKAEAIYAFYTAIYPRLFFVDWSGSNLSVYGEFESTMNQLSEITGLDFDVVVFDWIGGGLNNSRETDGGVKLELRELYKQAIETLINHGKRTNRVMIAMAQVNKTMVGPKKQAVVMADLAECKSMTDNVTNFIGISALRIKDSTGDSDGAKPTLQLKQYLNLDKARMGPGGLVPVEARFRHQRFAGYTTRLPSQ